MTGRFRRLLVPWERGLPARGASGRRTFCILHSAFCISLSALAAEVHVVERANLGGAVETLRDQTLYTGSDYVTMAAPVYGGYIFTHWSTTATEGFAARDALGRAYDAAPYTLYDNITLTANYVDSSLDSDADGIPDGYELYWYGGLAFSPDSDTDGDGFTFTEELAANTSPLLADRSLSGVSSTVTPQWLYNPNGYRRYTFRSEPEGELFETVAGYASPGSTVTTPRCDRLTSFFACWRGPDGNRVADAFGRALDAVSFTMPDADVEYVAVAEFDDGTRASLYWYGGLAFSPDSDTDGDGLTFAEELAAGTNPLFPDRALAGVLSSQTDKWFYNPNGYHEYTIRSEPEGAFFETQSGWATAGTPLSTPALDPKSMLFAYWTSNDVRVADAFGRALDVVAFTMPDEDVEYAAFEFDDEDYRQKMYWFGDASVSAQSDTDGDGLTFAEELAAGTNPHFPDRSLSGVSSVLSREEEMNLQPFEQVQGAIVDSAYAELFTSPVADNGTTSATFGGGTAIWPVVADLNGDGLFDIVILSATTTNVLLNVGSKGNPEFIDGGNAVATSGVDLAMNSTEKLEDLELDVLPPADALSATYGDAGQDGLADLLVSDSAGRIWYYRCSAGAGSAPSPYILQHKVWGGSYAGFAEGLTLAAVDWEEDGDLDCLAGTADGKLMLLRDPRGGRPVNLKAYAGVDNVMLEWDPNAQSRIRGYRLYRAEAENTDFARVAQPQLPTHRDFPPSADEYAYRVSSVSRFYTAGNSTPTETESIPSEPVTARIGDVTFAWRNANAKVGERVEVVLAIENALNFNVAGKSETVVYDPAYLRPVEVRKSGLTEGVAMTASVAADGNPPAGRWTMTMTDGVLPAGSGRFLTFVFEALQAGETRVGGETGAKVAIAAAAENAPYRLGDLNGDGLVTQEDLQLLARLKNGNGQKPTADQIMAGDFNGNGKLDNADFQALKKLLKDGGAL